MRAHFERSIGGQPDNRNMHIGAPRGKKCPEHIAAQLRNASPCERQHIFNLYAQHGEDWATGEVAIELQHKEQTQGQHVGDWFMEPELLERYKWPKIVAGIIASKRLDPQLHRPHPDAPTVPEATQYYCEVTDSSTKTKTSSATSNM